MAGDGSIDEEGRGGRAGAAPDYVWGAVIVPSNGFGEDPGGFDGGGEVCGDVVEPLGFPDCPSLFNGSIRLAL